MPFPEEMWGKCPVHGGGGTNDDVASSDSDTAEVFSEEDHAGEGYPLVYYNGRLMCKLCKKRLMADYETAMNNIVYRDRQRFWNKCGIRRTMED